MIVVDVESSGTEASKHSLVSIGAVDFKNPTRTFYEECRIWNGAHVMDEALVVNGYTEEQIKDPNKQSEADLVSHFISWAEASEDHMLAGHNPYLDIDFIKWATIRGHLNNPLSRRTIDLHTVCFVHMVNHGVEFPLDKGRSDVNSDFIMRYVGLPDEPKPHIALNGAKYEAEAFSRLLLDKNFFPEFSQFSIPWLN